MSKSTRRTVPHRRGAAARTVPANTVPANTVPANTVPATTAPATTVPSITAPAVTVLAVAVLAVAAVTGCSVVRAANNIAHAISANRAVIRAFASQLKSGKAAPFQATYVTTGSSPTTVTYAVQPPRETEFKEVAASNPSGSSQALDLVTNTAGEFSCHTTSPTASSGWTCSKLGTADAIAQNQIVSLYTPSHWITFLDVLSVGAGLAGDQVSTSTMSVNGISLNCVDFSARGQGRSTICSTSAGILGYVKVPGSSTSFEIKSYTTSPPTSDFQLPAGATVTKG